MRSGKGFLVPTLRVGTDCGRSASRRHVPKRTRSVPRWHSHAARRNEIDINRTRQRVEEALPQAYRGFVAKVACQAFVRIPCTGGRDATVATNLRRAGSTLAAGEIGGIVSVTHREFA